MVFLSTPLQIALAILLLYLFTAYLTTTFPTLSGKRVLLLIAHPDDEAMFFGPTLRYLTHPSLGNQIIVRCLSSGDADSLGHIRKSELQKSALQLGITSTEHVVVIEDEKFPDFMTGNWDLKAIGVILLRYFEPEIAHTPGTAAPTAYIDGSCTSPLDPARCRK